MSDLYLRVHNKGFEEKTAFVKTYFNDGHSTSAVNGAETGDCDNYAGGQAPA